MNIRNIIKNKCNLDYLNIEVNVFNPYIDYDLVFTYKVGKNLTLKEIEFESDFDLEFISKEQFIEGVKENVKCIFNSKSKEMINTLTNPKYGYASKSNCSILYSNQTYIGSMDNLEITIYPEGF